MPVPLFSGKSRPVTPLTIYGSDLVSWHRADLGVTTVGGAPNNVSDWADQTGNGHHLQQTVAGSRPTYVETGGANGGPYISSGTSGAATMVYIGTPYTQNTGNWSTFIIATTLTNPASAALFTNTATTPAGCVTFSWRRAGTEDLQSRSIGLSAPDTIALATPDFTPAVIWLGGLLDMSSGGTRTLRGYGDGTSGTISTGAHTGSLGIQLAEGALFRFGAFFYQNMAIQELGWVKRTSTTSDVSQMKAYFKTRGINTP